MIKPDEDRTRDAIADWMLRLKVMIEDRPPVDSVDLAGLTHAALSFVVMTWMEGHEIEFTRPTYLQIRDDILARLNALADFHVSSKRHFNGVQDAGQH